MVNGKIQFTHNPAMPFDGHIFYTVGLADCPQCLRGASVKLTGPSVENCTETFLQADRMTISTIGPVTFQNEFTFSRIRVLNNDIFCGDDATATKLLTILNGPQFGLAEVDATGEFIKYWIPMNTIVNLMDTITYQVCIGATCLTENLYLRVTFDPTCGINPQSDSFDLNQIGGTNFYSLDVLANDELCQLADYTVITITQQPASGTISVDGGKINYVNEAGAINDQFRYTLCTTNGFCSNTSAIVTLTK